MNLSSVSRIRISKRDLALLSDLYDNVFLSFYQISEEHFKGRAKPTVYNRLSKLIRSGLIISVQVNLKAHHRNHEDVGVIYKITKKGIGVLRSYFLEKHFREHPVPLGMGHLSHDLILTDVLRLFKMNDDLKVTNTKLMYKSQSMGQKIPDAVIESKNKRFGKLALELELTPKSERRYEDIVIGYRTDSEYEKVLYITANDQIRDKLGGVITGYKKNYTEADCTDMFYFMGLKEFLDPKGMMSFSNGKNRFDFNNNNFNIKEVM